MKRPIICVCMLAFMVNDMQGQAQTNTTAGDMDDQRTSTPFIDKLLRFFGISDSPSTLKGPGDEMVSGELWLADLDSGSTRPLTPIPGFRCPIFLSETKDVLALRGTDVVQIPFSGGEGKRLYTINSISKLIGAERDDRGKVLILLRGNEDSHPAVGFLTVRTGVVTVVPYDLASRRDLQMVENLEGWSRTYGDRRLYVKTQAKQILSGTVEWSDVFLKVGNREPLNISHGDGLNCGQPSLSENGSLVVFVKAKPE
jgi:hypothetical protein